MRQQGGLSPTDQVRAFHTALLELGHQPGEVFEGEEWTDRVMAGFDVIHVQSIRGYTDMGRAIRLWKVEGGQGRGNKKRVTLLPGQSGNA